MECLFCKIVNKETPAEIVYEDERIVVFKDIHPAAPVHFLFVPKEHIGSVADAEDKHKSIIAELIFAAKRIAAEQELSGYKLIFNVGREGGQIIDHLHLHFLGGWRTKKDVVETIEKSNLSMGKMEDNFPA